MHVKRDPLFKKLSPKKIISLCDERPLLKLLFHKCAEIGKSNYLLFERRNQQLSLFRHRKYKWISH